MTTKRLERTRSLLKRLAAQFIARNISLAGVMTTVTRVEIASNINTATIFLSIWPREKEKEMMSLLSAARKDFWAYLSRNLKMKRMPSFRFEIDEGEKARVRIEEILQKEKK